MLVSHTFEDPWTTIIEQKKQSTCGRYTESHLKKLFSHSIRPQLVVGFGRERRRLFRVDDAADCAIAITLRDEGRAVRSASESTDQLESESPDDSNSESKLTPRRRRSSS